MSATFADLGVPEDLVRTLARQGIDAPFKIQTTSIPDALAGRDVLGRAPTGSGKTLAFGIPLIANLEKARPRRPRALILSPTRELAEQIRRELDPLATTRDRTVTSVYGGVGFGNQTKALRNGVDIVVACPGRLLDLIQQNELSLNEVNQVVVDEAVRMADMGFLPAVREILDMTAVKRQTVMFSATLDKEVKVLVDKYQNNPVTHQVGEVEPDLSLVDHLFYGTRSDQKVPLAADLIDDRGPTIIFCRTRHGVDRVARQLKSNGVKSGWIHGGRSQNQRDSALHAFTSGKVQALVATDVAARGIHVDGVAAVIHFDPPADPKDYVHRSGRTARAGAGGVVYSFVSKEQVKDVKKMARQAGLPEIEVEKGPEPTVRKKVRVVNERPQKSGGQRNGSRTSKPAGGRPSGKPAGGRPSGKRSSSDRNEGRSGGSRDERTSSSTASREETGRPRRTERPSEGRLKSARNEGRPRRDRSERGRDWYPNGERPNRPEKRSERRARTGTNPASERSDEDPKGHTDSPRYSEGPKRGSRPSQGRSNGARPGGGGKAAGKSGSSAGKRSGKPRPSNRKGSAGRASKAKRS